MVGVEVVGDVAVAVLTDAPVLPVGLPSSPPPPQPATAAVRRVAASAARSVAVVRGR